MLAPLLDGVALGARLREDLLSRVGRHLISSSCFSAISYIFKRLLTILNGNLAQVYLLLG